MKMLDLQAIFAPDEIRLVVPRRQPVDTKSAARVAGALQNVETRQVEPHTESGLGDSRGGWHPDWLDLEWIEQVGPGGRRSPIHPDHMDNEWEERDWPEPCNLCGKWEVWLTLAGNWRCHRCDPPIVA